MNISNIRKRLGLTQSDVARKIGVDQTTVSQWETGKIKPRADTLIKLAKLFECTIDELLKS